MFQIVLFQGNKLIDSFQKRNGIFSSISCEFCLKINVIKNYSSKRKNDFGDFYFIELL